MIEQISNALTFLAFYTASGVGKTGLTVTVDVRRGSTSVISDGAVTEVGGGLYSYALASGSVTSEALYTAVFKTSDSTVDQKHLPALWTVGTAGVENLNDPIGDKLDASAYTAPLGAAATAAAVLDAAAADYNDAGSIGQKINAAGAASDPLLNDVPGSYAAGTAGYQLGRIGSAEVGVTAPVAAASGRVTLYQGKDYADADGTALEWTSSSTLDLTGASVTFDAAGEQFAAAVTGSAGAWTITVDLTAAETAALAVGVYPYEVVAELSPSGRTPPPLVTGTLEVRGER
ncbi:MAG: hypothetical protein JNL42_00410 [Anaerolineae bacterium]|nr:hypothetical protein [Anaerolineae bacterium]